MVSAEAFDRLASRPPTPPKEGDKDVDQVIKLLDVDRVIQLLDVDTIGTADEVLPEVGTPVQPSPPSSQEEQSQFRAAKRVEFSPCVTTHAPLATHSAATASPIPRRFPSSKQPRPVRSILKPSTDLQTPTPDGTASPAADYFSISDPKTFPVMLESVIKSLDSPSTAMRLDGYSTLNGALKAYENLPDVDAMRAKMPLLIHYMTRDISDYGRKTGQTGPMETSLTTQALKLVTAVLMTPALEDTFDEHFQTLLIDRTIEVLEQNPVPKSIANHHMYLLATQRFSSRIVTPTKAERIVSSLLTIHERVSGNSVIASRLVIFQRLLEQAQSTMLNNFREWVPHIFHGVLSTIKDIRGRAIDTGTQAATTLGTYYQATKVIIDLFHTATSEGGIYGNYFSCRLFDMASEQDLAEYVPQIWSMVILFFRSRKLKLSQWAMFNKDWLLIIQKSLNDKNIAVKFRATRAWNILVFVVNPDHETREKMEGFATTLRVPFMVAFNNKVRDRSSKEIRHIALSGYCNLLHYALRPTQPREDLDYYWDIYVHQVLAKLLKAGGNDAKMACRVLRVLFDGKSLVWDEDIANKAPILPEALPRLDPRWVRSRTRIILDLIGPYVEQSLSQIGNGGALAATPWPELMRAIAGAGSQEVRESVELKECLAHLMNFFGRLWTDASKNFKEQSDGNWISQFASLVQCSISTIGPLHFGEENLTRNQTHDFEPAPTPSHRTSKHHEVLQSSVVCLFGLFAQPPASIEPDLGFYTAARAILHQVCMGKQSRKWRLDIVRKCANSISTFGSAPLWTVAMRETMDIMTDSTLDESVQEPQRLGFQARHAVFILSSGLRFSDVSAESLSAAFDLMSVLAKILKQEAGDGGVALGLMEPIAGALLEKTDTAIPRGTIIQLATKLLRDGTFPRTRHQLEEARKSLWSTFPQHTKQGGFEPFEHVLELIKNVFVIAYEDIDESASHLAEFAEATQGFLLKCPSAHYASVLRKAQSGLSDVVRDDDRLLAGSKTAQRASVKIHALWQTILSQLKQVPSNGLLLKALDMLLSAGFESTHRDIVNVTVAFWNETFGRLDSLDYPPNIERAIRRIQLIVELDLPTFPQNPDEMELLPQTFIEAQEDPDLEPEPKLTPSKQSLSKRTQRFSLLNRGVSASPRRELPSASKKPLAKPAPQAKLRHNDSQVDFTAVEGSSPVAMESQDMTERQKEVLYRQHFETAPLYPEFSSSPVKPTSLGSELPRLNFSKTDLTDKGCETPPLEDQGPMDGYVGSSPTPKASEKNQVQVEDEVRAPEHILEDQPSEIDDVEIPSSPPKYEEDDLQNAGIGHQGVPKLTLPNIEASPSKTTLPQQETLQQGPPLTNNPALQHLRREVQSGTSSDAYMSAQSDLEATKSNEPSMVDQDTISNQEEDDRVEAARKDQESIESSNSSPVRFADSNVEEPAEEVSFRDATTIGEIDDAPVDGENSRVADSFYGGSVSAEEHAEAEETPKPTTRKTRQTPIKSASQPNTPTTRSTSKRKRGEETQSQPSAQRHVSNSPFKQIFAYFSTKPKVAENDQNEEMAECIVVASQADDASIADIEEEAPEQLAEEASMSEPAPGSVESTMIKRGRGRPRKSNTPISSPAPAPVAAAAPGPVSSPAPTMMTRSLKRRASALDGDRDESASQVSVVIETPAPNKSRRLTRSQDAKSGQMSELKMLPTPIRGRRGRKSAATTANPANPQEDASQAEASELQPEDSQPGTSQHEESQAQLEVSKPESEMAQHEDAQDDGQVATHDEEEDSQEAESQLKMEEQAAVIRNRPIAKPKSIIERLRGLITECKTLILRSPEERAIQDAMFELGREVYKARCRTEEGDNE